MANAKGAILLGPIKFLKQRRADAARVVPAALAHYLETDIRVSSWYPEVDFIGLVNAAAQLMPGTREEAIERMGVLGAQIHEDVYGDLIHALSSSSTFALWSTQHDSGELRGVWEMPTSSRLELVDFDAPSAENCILVRGYARGGLVANGLEDVRVEELTCVLRGAALCSWRATWKDQDATPVTPGRRPRRSASLR